MDRAEAWFLSGHRRLEPRELARESNDPGRRPGSLVARWAARAIRWSSRLGCRDGRGVGIDRVIGQVERLLELLERTEPDDTLWLLAAYAVDPDAAPVAAVESATTTE